uniref:Uncharacterized protein n=1 Tax=Timema bartmani TaxID=61472 RepID=A0A7R9EPP5_9NEOP|nr:unnamed protein product [Timema bartmani]
MVNGSLFQVSLFVIGLLVVKPRPALNLPEGLLTTASSTPDYQFFSTHLNPIPLNKLHSLTRLNLSLMIPWYNPLTIWNGSLGGDPQHSLTQLPSSQTPNMSHHLTPANSPLPVTSNNGEEIPPGGLTSHRSQPMQPRSVIPTRGGVGGTLDRAGSLYHHGILTSHRSPFLNLNSVSQNMIPYSPGARTYFLLPGEVFGGFTAHSSVVCHPGMSDAYRSPLLWFRSPHFTQYLVKIPIHVDNRGVRGFHNGLVGHGIGVSGHHKGTTLRSYHPFVMFQPRSGSLGGPSLEFVSEHHPEIVSGHHPEIVSGHHPGIVSGHGLGIVPGHHTGTIPGHNPEIVLGDSPQIISGHNPGIISGHHPGIVSVHHSGISSGNGPVIISGRPPGILPGHHLGIVSGHPPGIVSEHHPGIVLGNHQATLPVRPVWLWGRLVSPYLPYPSSLVSDGEHSVHYTQVPGGVMGHCTLPAPSFLTSEDINSGLRNASEAGRERVSYHAPVIYWDHHVVPEASRGYWSPHTTVGTTYPSANVCSNSSGCPHTPGNNNTKSSKKLVNASRSVTPLDLGMSRLHLLSLSRLLGLGAGIQGYGTSSSGEGKGLAAYVTRKYSHQVVDYGYGQVPTANIGSIPSLPPSGSYQQTNYTPPTAVSSPGYQQQASSSLSTPPDYQHQPALYKPPVYTLPSILPTVYHRVHSDYGYDVSKFSLDGSGLQESDKKIGVDAKIGIGKV